MALPSLGGGSVVYNNCSFTIYCFGDKDQQNEFGWAVPGLNNVLKYGHSNGTCSNSSPSRSNMSSANCNISSVNSNNSSTNSNLSSDAFKRTSANSNISSASSSAEEKPSESMEKEKIDPKDVVNVQREILKPLPDVIKQEEDLNGCSEEPDSPNSEDSGFNETFTTAYTQPRSSVFEIDEIAQESVGEGSEISEIVVKAEEISFGPSSSDESCQAISPFGSQDSTFEFEKTFIMVDVKMNLSEAKDVEVAKEESEGLENPKEKAEEHADELGDNEEGTKDTNGDIESLKSEAKAAEDREKEAKDHEDDEGFKSEASEEVDGEILVNHDVKSEASELKEESLKLENNVGSPEEVKEVRSEALDIANVVEEVKADSNALPDFEPITCLHIQKYRSYKRLTIAEDSKPPTVYYQVFDLYYRIGEGFSDGRREILPRLNHTNVLYCGAGVDTSSFIDVLMDYSLENLNDSADLQVPQIKFILYQLLNALDFLYKNNYYTGEELFYISPEQTLVNSNGLTKFVPVKRNTNIRYCPRENQQLKGVEGLMSRDIYSIGVILMVIMKPDHAFYRMYKCLCTINNKTLDGTEQSLNELEIVLDEIFADIKSNDPNFFHLITRMLTFAPRRISIEEAKNHVSLMESAALFTQKFGNHTNQ